MNKGKIIHIFVIFSLISLLFAPIVESEENISSDFKMNIYFCEEFPSFENLSYAALIDFPTTLFILLPLVRYQLNRP